MARAQASGAMLVGAALKGTGPCEHVFESTRLW
jgi:hypothetical protein